MIRACLGIRVIDAQAMQAAERTEGLARCRIPMPTSTRHPAADAGGSQSGPDADTNAARSPAARRPDRDPVARARSEFRAGAHWGTADATCRIPDSCAVGDQPAQALAGTSAIAAAGIVSARRSASACSHYHLRSNTITRVPPHTCQLQGGRIDRNQPTVSAFPDKVSDGLATTAHLHGAVGAYLPGGSLLSEPIKLSVPWDKARTSLIPPWVPRQLRTAAGPA